MIDTIQKIELEAAVKNDTLIKLKVLGTPVGFYVVASLSWIKGNKELYLAFQNDRKSPKIFKNLDRLDEYLRRIHPTISFEVAHLQELPQDLKEKLPKNMQKMDK